MRSPTLYNGIDELNGINGIKVINRHCVSDRDRPLNSNLAIGARLHKSEIKRLILTEGGDRQLKQPIVGV